MTSFLVPAMLDEGRARQARFMTREETYERASHVIDAGEVTRASKARPWSVKSARWVSEPRKAAVLLLVGLVSRWRCVSRPIGAAGSASQGYAFALPVMVCVKRVKSLRH